MPDFKDKIRARLADLKLSPARENEIIEELSQHLEDQYEQLITRGATEDEAYQTALLDLNQSDLLEPELRRIERRVHHEPLGMGADRKSHLLGDLWQDLRYGLRMLLKIALLAPMPRARAMTATPVNPGFFSSMRKP